MKIKSFAMLIASGLAAACLAYVTPAMADDSSGSDNTMQQPSSSSDNGSGTAMDQYNAGSDNGSASSMDQGSPDTATGDDDY